MRVVRVAKVVEHSNRFDDSFDGRCAEGGHTWRDDGCFAGEVLTQFIVQRANARAVFVSIARLQIGGVVGSGGARFGGQGLGRLSQPEPFAKPPSLTDRWPGSSARPRCGAERT